jgi:hypothetical protein
MLTTYSTHVSALCCTGDGSCHTAHSPRCTCTLIAVPHVLPQCSNDGCISPAEHRFILLEPRTGGTTSTGSGASCQGPCRPQATSKEPCHTRRHNDALAHLPAQHPSSKDAPAISPRPHGSTTKEVQGGGCNEDGSGLSSIPGLTSGCWTSTSSDWLSDTCDSCCLEGVAPPSQCLFPDKAMHFFCPGCCERVHPFACLTCH